NTHMTDHESGLETPARFPSLASARITSPQASDQQRWHLVRSHRRTTQEALVNITAMTPQELELLDGLDPLGDHLELQFGGDADHHAHNGCIVGVVIDIPHKGAIDLDLVDGKTLQIRKTGITR